MIINQFCKDASNPVPIIWALAIWTMGCLRVPKLNEYLIDPLLKGLDDEHVYVRKTAILCIPKVLEVSMELVLSKDLPNKIEKLLEKEDNPKIIATALITLRDINSFLNKKTSLKSSIVSKILNISSFLMEWD